MIALMVVGATMAIWVTIMVFMDRRLAMQEALVLEASESSSGVGSVTAVRSETQKMDKSAV